MLRECTVEDVTGLSPAAVAATSDALQRSAHCRLADADGADESPGESSFRRPPKNIPECNV